jgi:hypothetical protein
MFRISLLDTPHDRHLIIEGELDRSCAEEVRRIWNDTKRNVLDRRIVIDVAGVTFISCQCKEHLSKLMLEGAIFQGGGVNVRDLLQKLGACFQNPRA